MTFRRKWKVVARDVNHKAMATTDKCFTKRGAEKKRDQRQALVPVPIKGRPLYRHFVERNVW